MFWGIEPRGSKQDDVQCALQMMGYLARSTSSSQIDQHWTCPIQEMENIPSKQIKKTKLVRAKMTCVEKKMDFKQLEDAMDKMARGIRTWKGASKFLNVP